MKLILDELFDLDAQINDTDDESNNEYVNSALETITKVHEIIERLTNNKRSSHGSGENKSNLSNINLPRIIL